MLRSTMVAVDATKGQVASHRAYLRELGGKVLKTNESLERATTAHYESRTLLAALEKPGRF